jgi:hypothetical protein
MALQTYFDRPATEAEIEREIIAPPSAIILMRELESGSRRDSEPVGSVDAHAA